MAATVSLTPGAKTAKVNGKAEALDVGARLVNNRALIPLRFVAETFGAVVQYDRGKGISIALRPSGPTIANTRAFTVPTGLDKAPATKVTLFYPGQASWEFVSSPQHPGSQAILSGTGCLTCHRGQDAKLGEKLVKAGAREQDPIPGKDATVNVTVKAALR